MEFGVQHYLSWLIALFLVCVGFFLICIGVYFVLGRIKYVGNDEGIWNVKSSIKSRGNFNINIIVIAKAAGGIALMFGSISIWQLIAHPDTSYYERAIHQSGEVSSQGRSLTETLLQGLEYELVGRLELALTAYSNALKDRGITREARAFISNRIAEIRFTQGFAEEALVEARFAVEAGGSQPLYLHTLAKILIDLCLLDEAEQQLNQIQDINVITADLKTKITNGRGNCSGN